MKDEIEELDTDSLSGFFGLLLKVDKQENPSLYSNKVDEECNGDNL